MSPRRFCYVPLPDGKGGYTIRFGDPFSVEWYCEGRKATREEVMHSIRTGLPILREMAEEEGPKAVAALEKYTKEALKLVPAV